MALRVMRVETSTGILAQRPRERSRRKPFLDLAMTSSSNLALASSSLEP